MFTHVLQTRDAQVSQAAEEGIPLAQALAELDFATAELESADAIIREAGALECFARVARVTTDLPGVLALADHDGNLSALLGTDAAGLLTLSQEALGDAAEEAAAGAKEAVSDEDEAGEKTSGDAARKAKLVKAAKVAGVTLGVVLTALAAHRGVKLVKGDRNAIAVNNELNDLRKMAASIDPNHSAPLDTGTKDKTVAEDAAKVASDLVAKIRGSLAKHPGDSTKDAMIAKRAAHAGNRIIDLLKSAKK